MSTYDRDGYRKVIGCFRCGRFKRRASASCAFCGDDPLQYGGDRHSFDLGLRVPLLGKGEAS